LDQGVREAGVVSARASVDSARAARADLERGSVQDVTSAYEAYNTARATVDMQRVSVLVARENLRVSSLRYRTGAENILNLLTAQVSLTQAESISCLREKHAARARQSPVADRNITHFGGAMKTVAMILVATSLCVANEARAQTLPALETHLKPSETALILVDFQYPFTNPGGDSYAVVKKTS